MATAPSNHEHARREIVCVQCNATAHAVAIWPNANDAFPYCGVCVDDQIANGAREYPLRAFYEQGDAVVARWRQGHRFELTGERSVDEWMDAPAQGYADLETLA